MNHSERYDKYIKDIDGALEAALPKNTYMGGMLAYSLLAGGKRIRPMLLLAFCGMCGGDTDEAWPFAVALEMIHTYSLIHDDLPCMDNDDLRRGKPTSHKMFGEANATLAGDALLNLAFETMLSTPCANRENGIEAMRVIAGAAGCRGMIAGQVLDLENETVTADEDRVVLTSQLKTGALFIAACEAGVILAGGGEKQREAARIYAANIGIAFQIRDDMLNVSGSSKELGKSIGSDKKNNKTTFVDIFGYEGSEEKSTQYTGEAVAALDAFGDSDFVVWLSEFLMQREH